jgi:hypothetical protein
MRCLYCGKELALLKRLRGGGDFCSDAHKQSYQEEYNRLALSRLLQAQKKGQQPNSPASHSAPPPPQVSVAVEEPAPPVLEEAASVPAEAPEILTPALPDSAAEEAADVVPDSADVEAPVNGDTEPVPTAGFLLESPSAAAWPDEALFSEPWLEISAGPAMSEWALQNGTAFSLSAAELVSLDLAPKASSIGDPAVSSELSPHGFAGGPPEPPFSATPKASKKIANKNRVPAGGVIAIDIPPSAGAWAPDQSSVGGIGFESAVLMGESQLLELSPTGIDFPAEDSDVVALARSVDHSPNEAAPALVETHPEAAAEETPVNDNSPRASLDALSRLHQEMAEQEAARAPEPSTELAAQPVEVAAQVVEALPVEVVAAVETAAVESRAPDPETVEIQAEEPAPAEESPTREEQTLRPNHTTKLFEIPVRTFPPAKPALIASEPFPSHIGPLLPHLKSLPLRPKVALAPNYVPPSNTPSPLETKPAATTIAAVPAPSASKPVSSGKPAIRLTQPKRPAGSAGQSQVAAAVKPSAPRTPASSEPAAASAIAVEEPMAAPANRPDVPTTAEPEEKAPAANIVKPGPDAPKPMTQTAKPIQVQSKPSADQAKAAQPKNDDVPSFDMAEPANASWLGSLKVKLGLAIVLLVIACGYFLGWGGGKPHSAAGSNPASDGSGPSIILGEGGWVEGWGGDPTGLHVGRQITIYRPSLKLSDYRLQFQATIDAKSIGWVFRASDPANYYAMKLMTVSSGLSTKVALFKYLVVNGRQTQVGRVPIDLAVHPDTVFDVRIDVRGPQFTTYIQGQQVDSWTDDQLKVGGAGFLNEREERGNVKSVSIRYLSGAAK